MRGDLVEKTAADVCRDLAASDASGVLAIEGPDGPARVVFDRGRIIAAVSPAPRARLGDRLVGAGELDPDDLAAALRTQDERGPTSRLGSVLVEKGLVRPDAVRVFVQEQVLDALFEIIRWRYGAFAFTADDGTGPAGVPLSLAVDDALVEVARRQQEWQQLSQVIPDLEAIPSFRQGAATASASLEPDEFAVLASVDGDRSIRTLASDLGYGEFEAARIIYGLSLLGIVDVRLPQDATGAALEDALAFGPVDRDADPEPGSDPRHHVTQHAATNTEEEDPDAPTPADPDATDRDAAATDGDATDASDASEPGIWVADPATSAERDAASEPGSDPRHQVTQHAATNTEDEDPDAPTPADPDATDGDAAATDGDASDASDASEPGIWVADPATSAERDADPEPGSDPRHQVTQHAATNTEDEDPDAPTPADPDATHGDADKGAADADTGAADAAVPPPPPAGARPVGTPPPPPDFFGRTPASAEAEAVADATGEATIEDDATDDATGEATTEDDATDDGTVLDITFDVEPDAVDDPPQIDDPPQPERMKPSRALPADAFAELYEDLDDARRTAASAGQDPDASTSESRDADAASTEEPPARSEPAGPPPQRGDDNDVSEFLRELSRLSLDPPKDTSGGASRSKPVQPSQSDTSKPSKPSKPSSQEPEPGKKKRRGLFGRG